MLAGLLDDAGRLATAAVERSLPIPYEAALLFKALDPGHSAELLAQAARGQAEPAMLSAVITATRGAAGRLADRPETLRNPRSE